MQDLYLGLISGTSVDGVDAVLARFGDRTCDIVAARTAAYPPAIADRLNSVITQPSVGLAELGSLDVAVGRFFGDCAAALIRDADVAPGDVRAIGHHGQTVYHKPEEPEPFSMQLGDPGSVAAVTGIATVADLRGLDIALGGQGAPLVPAFHQWLFASAERARIVANIGGIANLTVLAPGRETLGFDTGPGNTLLDAWIRLHLGNPFDDGGRWAATGTVDDALLAKMKQEPYFGRPPPKSTGRELFNSGWLDTKLGASQAAREVDVQATLTELTATTIADAIAALDLPDSDIVVCGGGAHNDFLLERIGALTGSSVESTSALGLDPDWVEGAAFAWLAKARLDTAAGNVPSVTGARQAVTLGGLYLPPGSSA